MCTACNLHLRVVCSFYVTITVKCDCFHFHTSRGKHSRDIFPAIRLLVLHSKLKSIHNLDDDSDDGSVITFNHLRCCTA